MDINDDEARYSTGNMFTISFYCLLRHYDTVYYTRDKAEHLSSDMSIVPPSIVIIVSIVTSHPLPDLLLNNLDEGQKQDEIKTSF